MIYNFQRGANIVARIFYRQKTKKKITNLKKIELDALEFIKNKTAFFQKA